MVLILIVTGEILPLVSPEFPPNLLLSGSMLLVVGAVYALALMRASHRALSIMTAVVGTWSGVYGGITAADAGGFRSIHVLGMALVIGLLPGVFAVKLRYGIASVGGSLVMFFLSCALRLQHLHQPLSGIDVATFYCLFGGAFTILAVEQNRRLRRREFVAQQVAARLHRFAVEEMLFRHLPKRFVERVLAGEQSLNAAPERRVVTVMFADIVGFTPMSEQLPPEKLAALVARYYQTTAAAAFAEGATIDKFIGDAVMAILGAPESMDPKEQAQRAIAIARAWHEAAEKLNVNLRIGVHQDVVAAGMFGDKPRSDYTVLGRGVNIAARLEQRCRPGEILISREVMEKLDEKPDGVVELGPLALKGIPSPVHCFAIPVRPVRDETVAQSA